LQDKHQQAILIFTIDNLITSPLPATTTNTSRKANMTSLDPAVSAILDRTSRQGADEEDEDELINALEQDDTSMAAFREQRLQQLHSELSRAKDMRNSDHGTYTEVKDEKKLMDLTTTAKLCVVHFMKPDFARCRIMDQKLEVLLSR